MIPWRRRLRMLLLLTLLLIASSGHRQVDRTPLVLGGGGGGTSGGTSFAPDNLGAWTVVTQGVDQDVVNSTTLASSNLCFVEAAATVWEIQMHLKYSGNNVPGLAPGIQLNMTLPALSIATYGHARLEGINAAGQTVSATQAILTFPGASVGSATLGDLARPGHVWFWEVTHFAPAGAGGTVCFAFANFTAGVGLTTRLWAASTLAYRQILAP